MAGNSRFPSGCRRTQSLGSSVDGHEGAGVVTAEVWGQYSDLAPLALTGGNVTFETDGSFDNVLTSTGSVNDGNYHHVVVTREMARVTKIFILTGHWTTPTPGTTARS